jgi:hypothetical protein
MRVSLDDLNIDACFHFDECMHEAAKHHHNHRSMDGGVALAKRHCRHQSFM